MGSLGQEVTKEKVVPRTQPIKQKLNLDRSIIQECRPFRNCQTGALQTVHQYTLKEVLLMCIRAQVVDNTWTRPCKLRNFCDVRLLGASYMKYADYISRLY
jgi:hypothetical protein